MKRIYHFGLSNFTKVTMDTSLCCHPSGDTKTNEPLVNKASLENFVRDVEIGDKAQTWLAGAHSNIYD